MGDITKSSMFIKQLPLKVQQVGPGDKHNLFQNLYSVIDDKDTTKEQFEEIAAALWSIFKSTNDRFTHRLTIDAVTKLVQADNSTGVVFLQLLDVFSDNQRNLVATESTSQYAFAALAWSNIISKCNGTRNETQLPVLMEIQAKLLCCILAVNNPRKSKKAHAMLRDYWKDKELLLAYSKATIKPSMEMCVLESYLLECLLHEETYATFKLNVVDMFVKSVIASKVRPGKHIVSGCKILLKSITEQEFKEHMLPAMIKGLLRNAEIILESVGDIIEMLSIYIDDHSVEIANTFLDLICSTNEIMKDTVIKASQQLAMKCTKECALLPIIKRMFDIYHATTGRLITIDQKLSVLQVISALSDNKLDKTEMENLGKFVVDSLVSILNTEVHEKIVVLIYVIITQWCTKKEYVNASVVDTVEFVPQSLHTFIKKCLNKGFSNVKIEIAFIECMAFACKHLNDEQVDYLMKTITKCTTQSQAQVNSIAVGVSAIFCLLHSKNMETDDALSNTIYNLLFQLENQCFLSDKFIKSSSNEIVWKVLVICSLVVREKAKNRKEANISAVYTTILACASSADYQLCDKAKSIILETVYNTNAQIIIEMLEQFSEFIKSVKSNDLETENGEMEGGYGRKKMLSQVLHCICRVKRGTTSKDVNRIALCAFLPSHHENIDTRDLWEKLLREFNIKASEFIRTNEKSLIKLLIEEYDGTKSMERALKYAMQVQGETFLTPLMKRWTAFLESDELLKVTQEQYEIFKTNQGQLYNKSIALIMEEGGNKENEKNVKRENKAYSYKEQQEEIQLRKELQEKKKKEQGKVVVNELTEKQKKMIQDELQKEETIRMKVSKLKEELWKVISMMNAALEGNSVALSLRYRFVIPMILRNMQSPLAAHKLVILFLKMSHSVFQDVTFANFIAHLILRYQHPKCEINPEWTNEPLEDASKRALSKLQTEMYSNCCLAYYFPLLESLALSSSMADSVILQQILTIIMKYASNRSIDKQSKKYNSPKLLPRTQMFHLLIYLIGETGAMLQQLAIETLLQVSATCSTDDGCDPASIQELNCLLIGLHNHNPIVRDAVTKALRLMSSSFPSSKKDHQLRLKITKRIWIARHDVSTDNRMPADELWNEASLDHTLQGLPDSLLEDVISPIEDIQRATALALAALLELLPDSTTTTIIRKLLNIYQDKLTIIPAVLDDCDNVLVEAIDEWEARRGVAFALEKLTSLIPDDNMLINLINFYIGKGLSDRNEVVRNCMLSAGTVFVTIRGKDSVDKLLPILEKFLRKPLSDKARSGVVVLMGTLAQHLSADDAKLNPIVDKLIEALSTPSQEVQEAVAACLPGLISKWNGDNNALVTKLINRLLNGNSFGDRKGAAYGLSGVIKGLGVTYFKENDVNATLVNALQSKNYKHREGALFGFEMLGRAFGRLFEPYIVHILPSLLTCFGDNSNYVRIAADECAKVLMSKLSGYGVKLILPSLLTALEDESWRTKTGSVELLGTMAYCAPRQLSSCLPNIVPKLINVLSDSHIKVQQSCAQALKMIASVIRNPEIQSIVPVLLDALCDPLHKIMPCLNTLLQTKFVHFIDAPSLALIMPVVQRAFMERSMESRKLASQIIGNMYSLTDQKDLAPYLPNIMPGLKSSLLDPAPEVRSVSSRALGAMVKGMGESCFEDLIPWLMLTLTSETSAVDRSGAAQGLCEVVGGLGVERFHSLMPDIIGTSSRMDVSANVKDGYLMMYIYMPAVFPDEFKIYIGQIIVPILRALADENEYVRDTALKAGRRIVNMYADSSIQLLLPELEKGLFDDNWRIRYSSVQLIGDLLYRISGVTGKMTTETNNDDDNFGTEHSHKVILATLGLERRNRVLAGLYMGRSDVSSSVRQTSLHVWKVVVTNTPRTLREILITLFSLLLDCLASHNFDKRQVAGRTLADVVRKLGERVLPEVIPLLEKGLQSDEPMMRQGVCIGLSEIISATSRDMTLVFIDKLIPTVRKTLCDLSPQVRCAAAKTFDSLHSSVGSRALDDILPFMIDKLKSKDTDEYELVLDGLRHLVAIKSRIILPYLLPHLLKPPIDINTLAILSSSAGHSLTRYLNKILPALLKIVAASDDKQDMELCQKVVLAVVDEGGIRVIMDLLNETIKSTNVVERRAAVSILSSFCKNTKADYSQYVSHLIRFLINLFTEQDEGVLLLVWDALDAIFKTADADNVSSYIADVRQAIRGAVNELNPDQKYLPGFSYKKGITTLMPLYREGMAHESLEIREQAVLALEETVKLASADCIKASMILIAGPLIRYIGERHSPSVRAIVIGTLAILLQKTSSLQMAGMMKQFLPQLQTTCLRSLTEPYREVRIKCAIALGRLASIHNRADLLFTELYALMKAEENPSLKETMLYTLRLAIISSGQSMLDAQRRSIFITLRDSMNNHDESLRLATSAAIGSLTKCLSPEQLNAFLTEHIFVDDSSTDSIVRHARSTALFVALKECAPNVYTNQYKDKINKLIISYLHADKAPVVSNGIRAAAYLFIYLVSVEEAIPPIVLSSFSRSMNHPNNDVKQLAAKACLYMSRFIPEFTPELLKTVVPMLINGSKERNTFVKSNCEISLIAVLQLRKHDQIQQKCMTILDVGARDTLNEVISKVLKKVTTRFEGKEEELDNTLLVP